jgi:hypothetical protein
MNSTTQSPLFFVTFKGRFQNHPVRKALGTLHSPTDGVIIADSEGRHKDDFSYADLLGRSNYTLILRGDNEYSYRFTEAVCSNAVAVLITLDHGWVPPFSSLIPFETYGVRLDERGIRTHLLPKLRSISESEHARLKHNAHIVCDRFLASVEKQADAMVLVAATGGLPQLKRSSPVYAGLRWS